MSKKFIVLMVLASVLASNFKASAMDMAEEEMIVPQRPSSPPPSYTIELPPSYEESFYTHRVVERGERSFVSFSTSEEEEERFCSYRVKKFLISAVVTTGTIITTLGIVFYKILS